jgi:hypothetical protein
MDPEVNSTRMVMVAMVTEIRAIVIARSHRTSMMVRRGIPHDGCRPVRIVHYWPMYPVTNHYATSPLVSFNTVEAHQ